MTTITEAYDGGFFDFGTRAIFVSANLYNPILNRLIEIMLVMNYLMQNSYIEKGFEFTTGGYVIPLPSEVQIYRQIRYATEHYGVRYEIVQGICAVLLLIFLLYMTVIIDFSYKTNPLVHK